MGIHRPINCSAIAWVSNYLLTNFDYNFVAKKYNALKLPSQREIIDVVGTYFALHSICHHTRTTSDRLTGYIVGRNLTTHTLEDLMKRHAVRDKRRESGC